VVSLCGLRALLLWPMYTYYSGRKCVTRTLLFHTYCSCAGTVIGLCTHNHTIYSLFSHGNQDICFNLT
jgi:hypothetical protein